ncbi:hypothetical protein VPH35_008362 [Triticum aestivum]
MSLHSNPNIFFDPPLAAEFFLCRELAMAAPKCVVERSREACLLQNCLCTLITVAAVVRAQFSSCTIILYSIGRNKEEYISVLMDAFVLYTCISSCIRNVEH